jgi:hypothetical protein
VDSPPVGPGETGDVYGDLILGVDPHPFHLDSENQTLGADPTTDPEVTGGDGDKALLL